jgi:hypothetical protein
MGDLLLLPMICASAPSADTALDYSYYKTIFAPCQQDNGQASHFCLQYVKKRRGVKFTPRLCLNLQKNLLVGSVKNIVLVADELKEFL